MGDGRITSFARRAATAALVLATCAGAAAAGPGFDAMWGEAQADGSLLLHCRVDLRGATQESLELVVQFRHADPSLTARGLDETQQYPFVKQKDGQNVLLLFPAVWKRPAREDAPAAGVAPPLWRPQPLQLNAAFFAEQALLAPGVHFVDAILDLYDPAAKQYVASSHPRRISMKLTVAPGGRAELAPAGCDVVLHCNGKLDEMVQVAAESPELAGEALARADRALASRRTPQPFDRGAARAELDRLIDRAGSLIAGGFAS